MKKIKFKILYLFHKLIKKEKCYIYCKPCEWYGVCPHSYNENDKENLKTEDK